MHRRSFLGAFFAPLLLPVGFNLTDYAPLHSVSGLQPLGLKKGQTVEDIIISFRTPCDVASVIQFYRQSKPESTVLQFALNHRGLFRWAPVPSAADAHIVVPTGDVLAWRIAQTSGGSPAAYEHDLDVWTLGRDLASNRAIVNQSQYLNP